MITEKCVSTIFTASYKNVRVFQSKLFQARLNKDFIKSNLRSRGEEARRVALKFLI